MVRRTIRCKKYVVRPSVPRLPEQPLPRGPPAQTERLLRHSGRVGRAGGGLQQAASFPPPAAGRRGRGAGGVVPGVRRQRAYGRTGERRQLPSLWRKLRFEHRLHSSSCERIHFEHPGDFALNILDILEATTWSYEIRLCFAGRLQAKQLARFVYQGHYLDDGFRSLEADLITYNPNMQRVMINTPKFKRTEGGAVGDNITSFYGSSCSNNGKGALNSPEWSTHPSSNAPRGARWVIYKRLLPTNLPPRYHALSFPNAETRMVTVRAPLIAAPPS
eukprot:1183642-Prorocentrum_minimum.AAC.4